ncbi:MAG: hypothetical protein KA175_16410 [Flavobacteriales bacterium]|nr:hypothetical protein [Flavobacteriales bacterium]MBP6699207.1 hypothetical protein [Flavobacteriales bacterium]
MLLEHLALICFTVVLIVIMVSFMMISRAAFSSQRQGAAKSLGLLFQRAGAFRIVTVLMVVFATVMLQVLGDLGEGAIGILGSVAGYALGGLDLKRESRSDGASKEAQ